jgi:hypothetical protein
MSGLFILFGQDRPEGPLLSHISFVERLEAWILSMKFDGRLAAKPGQKRG